MSSNTISSHEYIYLMKICTNNRPAPFSNQSYSPSHPQGPLGSPLQAPNAFQSPRYLALNSVLNSVEVDAESHSRVQVQLPSSLSPADGHSDYARPPSNTQHVIEGFEGIPNTMSIDLSNDEQSNSWWARTAVRIELGGGMNGGLGRDPLEELLDGYVVPNYI